MPKQVEFPDEIFVTSNGEGQLFGRATLADFGEFAEDGESVAKYKLVETGVRDIVHNFELDSL